MAYSVLDTNLRLVPEHCRPSRAKYLVESRHQAHFLCAPGIAPHPTEGTIILHEAIQPDDNRGPDDYIPAYMVNADGEYLGWTWLEHCRPNRRFVYDAMEARPEKVPWFQNKRGRRALVLRDPLDEEGIVRMRRYLIQTSVDAVLRRADVRDTLTACARTGTDAATVEQTARYLVAAHCHKPVGEILFSDFRRLRGQMNLLDLLADPDCRDFRSALAKLP